MLTNFYMEREWRVPEGVSFHPGDIARLIVAREFIDRLHADIPEYSGPVSNADNA